MGNKLADKMEAELREKLESAFDSVVKQKNEYYQSNPLKVPEKGSVSSLIGSVALANSAISGGASLVPGPWGMLAVVPELVLVIRNQIGLIYDIAAANGQKDVMTKELAAMIFASGMGTSVGGLAVVHGGKYLVKRASLQVFQKIVILLGGKITQQALKSAVSKWLPGVGAVAMAAWTNYMTRQIGKKASEIFSSGIVFEDSITDIELVKPETEEPVFSVKTSTSIDFIKIKTLTILMKIDGKIAEEELAFIAPLIENADVSDDEKSVLISGLTDLDRTLEGIELVAKSPSDAIALLADLVALAKIDNNIHVTEKLFIKQIGKLLHFSETDVDELINS